MSGAGIVRHEVPVVVIMTITIVSLLLGRVQPCYAFNGGEKPSIAAIVDGLRGNDPRRQTQALNDLQYYRGSDVGEAVEVMISMLHHPDWFMRSRVAYAIGQIGPPASSAVPHLARLLREDPIGSVRVNAADGLSHLGAAAKEAVPDLCRVLRNDGYKDARLHAATALRGIGPHAYEAVDYLVEALRDPYSPVRDASIEALGEIGEAAASAVQPLILMIKMEDYGHKLTAVVTLGKIGPLAKDAAGPLVEVLRNDESSWNRRAAAEALAGLAEGAWTEYGRLTDGLNDEDARVRRETARALQAIALGCQDDDISEVATDLEKAVGVLHRLPRDHFGKTALGEAPFDHTQIVLALERSFKALSPDGRVDTSIETTKKTEGSDDSETAPTVHDPGSPESVPSNPWAAVLAPIWNSGWRTPIIVLLVCLVVLFAVWKSLPDPRKDSIIDRLVAPFRKR